MFQSSSNDPDSRIWSYLIAVYYNEIFYPKSLKDHVLYSEINKGMIVQFSRDLLNRYVKICVNEISIFLQTRWIVF